eukprot:scaffold131022_cov51-Phaeocystis_antarctica.AAC.2
MLTLMPRGMDTDAATPMPGERPRTIARSRVRAAAAGCARTRTCTPPSSCRAGTRSARSCSHWSTPWPASRRSWASR